MLAGSPWLKQHPEWFKRRPDGSIQYAENPPKKYEDIVNPDFYCADRIALWQALRDVILFWVQQGVRIFRVDNPHTKPFPFWEWLIHEVQGRDPNVLFLSEAFSRPKIMKGLAKLGFSQSYSYFTWRTHKAELQEYLSEITRYPEREYFRPNFFVSTPDILPVHLQKGEPWMFKSRVALAATLSGNYGIYNGFELIEHEPVQAARNISTPTNTRSRSATGTSRATSSLTSGSSTGCGARTGLAADQQPAFRASGRWRGDRLRQGIGRTDNAVAVAITLNGTAPAPSGSISARSPSVPRASARRCAPSSI